MNLDLQAVPTFSDNPKERKAKRAELELQTERRILDFLNTELRIGFFWKNVSVGVFDEQAGVYRRSTNPYAIKGTSDILGIWPNGRLIAIEVKRPGNENGATVEQLAFIAKINRLGGLAFVATSVEKVRLEFQAAKLLS